MILSTVYFKIWGINQNVSRKVVFAKMRNLTAFFFVDKDNFFFQAQAQAAQAARSPVSFNHA